eukprot:TRINITY_DN51282_c0_g1_i1.p1 TRINITY_DN51282_c0_g1~~TRINITY_DN51282_c0_g1_i1.p1  ORF type:complete len:231 (+),score=93.68 TRINITY_DN51282_c0_g1_i1:40-732(+)
MAELTLYTYPDNVRCMKVQLAAAYADLKLNTPQGFDFGTETGCSNKAPYYIRNAHPLGKVPVLETPEGCIFDSFAILRHIARLAEGKGLYGSTPFQQSQCDEWLELASQELTPFATLILGPVHNMAPHNAPAEEEAVKHIKQCLAGMDTWLETRTFFVGEKITIADIALVSTLLPLYQFHFTPAFIQPYVHLSRWFNTCIAQPLFQDVLRPGKLLQAKKAAPETKGKKQK